MVAPFKWLWAFIEDHWWVALLLIAAGIVAAVLLLHVGPDTGPKRTEIVQRGGHTFLQEHRGGRDSPGWVVPAVIASILVGFIGLLALVSKYGPSNLGQGESRKAKIDKLSASLTEALSVIETIRAEVADGQRLVSRLEQEAEVKAQLAKLASSEAQAVLAQMRETVRAETNRGTRYQFMMSAAFFLLGVVVTFAFFR